MLMLYYFVVNLFAIFLSFKSLSIFRIFTNSDLTSGIQVLTVKTHPFTMLMWIDNAGGAVESFGIRVSYQNSWCNSLQTRHTRHLVSPMVHLRIKTFGDYPFKCCGITKES